jgi:hypothetical protein
MYQPVHSTNEALATLLQQYQVNPIQKPVLYPGERLPMATPVLVRIGREIVLAVVSGYNANDMQRVRVSWFDTVDRVVRHKFVDQQMVAVVEKQKAVTAA